MSRAIPEGQTLSRNPVAAEPDPFAVELRSQAAEALKHVGGVGRSGAYLGRRQLKVTAPLTGRDASVDNERASR